MVDVALVVGAVADDRCLSLTAADAERSEAAARVAHSDAESNARFRDQERARGMLAMARGR